MDARKVTLIQQSFEKITVLGSQAADIFYAELFAIDPSLRSLFSDEMRDQHRKLLSALAYVVRSLPAPERILNGIENLARAHVDHGVKPEYYTLFGNALLRMLRKELDREFTPELSDAWTEAFRKVARIMIEAAYGSPAEAWRQRDSDTLTAVISRSRHCRRNTSTLLARKPQMRAKSSNTSDAATAQLRAQNLQLQTALNNINQGLSMFDGASRLLLCNTSYLSMYGLQPQLVGPGCTLQQLLELKVKAGTFFGDIDHTVDRILDAIARGEAVRIVNEWINGTVIAVVASPIGEGAWMATHEDITERTNATRELYRTKNFLDTVIEHVPATILVKDAKTLRYLLVNKKGEEFIGCAKQHILGRTAHEIFSPQAATAITDNDRLTLCNDYPVGFASAPFHHPGDDSQIVFTKKFIVHKPNGEPDYLLSIIEDMSERVHVVE